MFGLGVIEFIIIVAIIVFALVIPRAIKSQAPMLTTLVLRRFDINSSPKNEDDNIIYITGRPGGVIDWFMTLVGIDTESSLRISARELSFKDASLFGQKYSVVALNSISSAHCGYRKPLELLIVSIFLFLFGFPVWIGAGEFLAFLIILLASGVSLLFYWLMKKVHIMIQTRGGLYLGLAFKRSVIENVPLDIDRVKVAISIVNKLVTAAQKSDLNVEEIVNSAISSSKDNEKIAAQKFCVHCGRVLDAGSKYCTSCGHSA